MKSLDKQENRLYNKYHTKHTDLICNERTVPMKSVNILYARM